MTQTDRWSRKILMVPTVFTQTESKSYGNKPSPESSSADENKHYSQVTISQKLLTAYKETKKNFSYHKTSFYS